MNKKPKHFDELCRQIGIAVLLGQIVESMLARYIAVKLRLEAAAAVHQVQEALAAADSKPLGALIKHIKKNCPFPKLLTDQLELFRDERNWLIHRLNREHEMATFREDASLPVFS